MALLAQACQLVSILCWLRLKVLRRKGGGPLTVCIIDSIADSAFSFAKMIPSDNVVSSICHRPDLLLCQEGCFSLKSSSRCRQPFRYLQLGYRWCPGASLNSSPSLGPW